MKALGVTGVIKKPDTLIGVRHVQIIVLFFGMVLAFNIRVNLSVAIVAMTDSTNEAHFDWSMQIQSVILSSFIWGYVCFQIPGGELATRYGGTLLVIICMAVNSIASLLVPVSSYFGGWGWVCACRMTQGLFQGLLYPSVHNLLSKWVPLEEKNFLSTFVYAGAQLGTAIQLIISGFIADAFGWEAIFYISGVLGLVWTVLYTIVGSPTPEKSRFIGLEEKTYIQHSLGHSGEETTALKTPWKSIITSVPLMVLVLAQCGFCWGFWTLATETPTYASKIIGVNIKTSGIISALPFLAMYLMSFPFGITSDYVLKKKYLSVTACRKISNSIGSFGPALMLVGLAFVPTGSFTLPILLLTAAVGLNAGVYTGFLLVHLDMAPNFAASLMGISNCLGNIAALLAPLVAGALIKDESNPADWQKVFFVSAAVYCGCNLVYIIFGTSETQKWNDPPNKIEKDDSALDTKNIQTLS